MKRLFLFLFFAIVSKISFGYQNHWKPEMEQFASYMNVLCVVDVDDVEQNRTDLEIGAFCGSQCRGSKFAQLFPVTGKYIFRLAVYGNSGDGITFRLYDHTQQAELEVQSPTTLVWQTDGFGTLGSPFVMEFYSSAFEFVFTNVSGNRWSTKANWNTNIVPGSENIVAINGQCQLDVNTEVSSVTISDGNTLTINEGKKLTVDEMFSDDVTKLVIENGAQLVHDNVGVAATLKKSITGFGSSTNSDYWNLIAIPMSSAVSTSGITVGTYDLYSYDEANALWINAKMEGSTFDFLNPRQGYLYANAATQEVSMVGTLNPSGEDLSFELSFLRDEEDGLKGFNLVGNPFACDAYLNMPYYVLNDDGSAFVSTSSNVVVKPGFAVLVQATDENQSVTFSKDVPVPNCNLHLTISNQYGLCDRAILGFGKDDKLGKFIFNENNCQLVINQNGKDYAVTSLTDKCDIPVCFKSSKDGAYTIGFETENINCSYLHLVDNLTGANVDLLATPTYTFQAKNSDYPSRFVLQFKANVENDENETDSNCFAFVSGDNIIVTNEGRASLIVIDLTGRIISNQAIDGDSRISTTGMTSGVYVLNLAGKTQKIVLK